MSRVGQAKSSSFLQSFKLWIELSELNQKGESAHERYKARQVERAMRRIRCDLNGGQV